MKKLSTISLFIFGVVVTAILTAGLVFYQNSKSGYGGEQGSLVAGEINKIISSGKSIILDMTEISKHNKSSDCWMLISGKVYDVTSYFGSHPGGNSTMSPTCGTDATAAYATMDPYAKTSGSRVAHSSDAKNALDSYYLGDFNQTLGKKDTLNVDQSPITSNSKPSVNTVKNNAVNSVIAPVGEITLNLSEIAKHNKQSDCFLLVSGKVYNITSFFGSHPGGNSTMLATCGTDATAAYATQNPNATSSGSRSAHSSNATGMLNDYYIGDLNQTIGQQKVVDTNTIPAPTTRGGDDEEEDDD